MFHGFVLPLQGTWLDEASGLKRDKPLIIATATPKQPVASWNRKVGNLWWEKPMHTYCVIIYFCGAFPLPAWCVSPSLHRQSFSFHAYSWRHIRRCCFKDCQLRLFEEGLWMFFLITSISNLAGIASCLLVSTSEGPFKIRHKSTDYSCQFILLTLYSIIVFSKEIFFSSTI